MKKINLPWIDKAKNILKADKLLMISSLFVVIFLFAVILGYLLPKRLYLYPSPSNEEKLNAPTFGKHILVKAGRKIESSSPDKYIAPIAKHKPLNYEPLPEETIITDNDGIRRIFPPHPFGTDEEGRDVALRILVGARVYLFPSIIAILISMFLGSLLGIMGADFWGGLWKPLKFLSQSFMDMLEAMPKYITILLAIIIIPPAIRNFKIGILQWYEFYWLAMILGLLNAPKIGKLIMETINALQKREFIESATAIGLSKFTIAVKHVLRYNCIPLFITQAAIFTTEVILIEITLSYLGDVSQVWGLNVTVDSPYPSWGNILIMGRPYFLSSIGWWLNLFPLLIVMVSVSMIYLFGYSLNKVLMQERVSTEI